MNLSEISKSTIISNSECSPECRNKLLKLALSIVQPQNQDKSKLMIGKISNDFNIPKGKVTHLLGLYLAIVKLFIESTEKEFNSKLIDFGFPPEFVEELPLASNRSKVISTIINAGANNFGSFTSLKWRIDISLSNSALIKKIPVNVILCFQLQNGQKVTVNVDIRTFHKLRFNIALLIKELTNLKSSHILNK